MRDGPGAAVVDLPQLRQRELQERQAALLTLLYEVSERLISAPDPTGVAVIVSRSARHFLDCDGGGCDGAP